jgi:NAD+ synthase
VSRDLAGFLGISRREVNVKPGVDAVLGAMREAGLEPGKQATINTPARIRITTL